MYIPGVRHRPQPVLAMYRTSAVVITFIAALGLLMWALVGPDVEGIPTRIRPYGEGAFLVFPKYRDNTYSLALQSGKGLHPYPSRHAHERGIITNAVDIHLDSRGTLWVLDSGVVRTLGRPLKKSGPKVLALDADSGEIKRTVPLEGLVRGRAQFLEVEESIRGPERLYVSDGPSRCIAVWDVSSGKGRRLILPRAVSHPSDVLYLALVPPSNLYFTYYKSPDMYVVDTKDERGLVRKVGSKPPGVILIGREGRNILFRVSGSQRLYSWNTQKDLSRHTFKQRDVGGLGDPLHAVADIGRTWVLEADLSAFLSGKKVSHRIRAIHHNVSVSEHQEQNTEIPCCMPPSNDIPEEKELQTTTPMPPCGDQPKVDEVAEVREISTTPETRSCPLPGNVQQDEVSSTVTPEQPSTSPPMTSTTEDTESLSTTPAPSCCSLSTVEEPEQEQPSITAELPVSMSSTNITTYEELPTSAPPEVVIPRPPPMVEEMSATTTPGPVLDVETDKKLVPSPPM